MPTLRTLAVLLAVAVVATLAAVVVVGNPFTVEHDTAAPAARQATAPAAAVSATTAPTARATPPIVVATAQAPATGSPAPTVTAQPRTYLVQPGDSLTSVAQQFGVSVQALAAANGLAPDALLDVGQTLRIPASAPAAGPTPVR